MISTNSSVAISLHKTCINTIRTLAMDAVQAANSGHPGMPMGTAPMAYVLWTKFLRHNPRNPRWQNRDRFVLSAGHGSMLLYSLLHLTGYDLTLEELKRFRQWGSRTAGHPESHLLTGVETTTGPLGQGFANGVGMAIGGKFRGARYNRPGFEIFNYTIYGIVSDGDLMEGVASEAASLAGHLKLGNIIYLYDDNRITIDGPTDLAFSEDVLKRFDAYGWYVLQVDDGNDLDAIERAIAAAQRISDRPSLIKVRTHIAYGSPNKQDTAEAHGAPLGEEEVLLTKKNLGWESETPFHIPPEVLQHFRSAVQRGQLMEDEWNQTFERYRAEFPDLAARWLEESSGNWGETWKAALPTFSSAGGMATTRQASGKVIEAIAPHLPTLIGGSADLTPSNNTRVELFDEFQAGHYDGRYIRFGVREHAMGGILNGLAHTRGLIPYGGTFLIFSDYMRPTLRLAALMQIRPIFVFTHDSIGLGEDGPTHQPVEHLMSLRAIPNMLVLRPADANETAEAWKVAIEHTSGPVALILTRQKVPILDQRRFAPAANLSHGAYVLAPKSGDPEAGLSPDLIIIATGSEVHLAIDAREELEKEKIRTWVVSMPSWELFERQDKEYRDAVLPPTVKKRLAVEAGSPLGWHKFVGDEGDIIGITTFGASAPGDVVMREYGFTVGNVVQRAKRLLGR